MDRQTQRELREASGVKTNTKFYAELKLDLEDELDKESKALHELEKKLILERVGFKRKLEHERLMAEKQLEIKLQQQRQKEQQRIEQDLAKLKAKDLEKYNAKKKKFEEQLEKDLAKTKQIEERKRRQADFEEMKKHNEELAEQYGVSLKNNFKLAKESLKVDGIGTQLGKAFREAGRQTLTYTAKLASDSVNNAMTAFSGVYSTMNARLQGSEKSARNIVNLMNKNLAVSPFVKYEDMLNNTAALIEKGIAYNVEERAFLMTIKDKIADTFDVANGTLLQIIRIQQADSTRARMGMEASLTQFLNRNFQDTSYLSDVYDTVTDAVADSVVQLGTKGGAEYEYQMQKWLGSLYSMGISSNTVTSLASAINMLATGDVSGLENSNMQNLLVMAANKSGMNYGDLLTQGVNASNVNALMSNVVSYWSQLAQNDNQVVRKQYAGLFGLDMADLVAIRNVDQKLMNRLTSTQLDYAGMNAELNSQLGQVAGRMHISELINNTFNNAIQGIGRTIAESPFMMATWLVNDLIKQTTGGINIPFITAMGSGIGLETDLNSIIQLGMVGAGTLGQIGNIIAGIGSGGGLNLNAWGHSDMTKRGTGLGGVVSGVKSSTSQTTFIGNANSSDIYDSSLHAAYDSVDKTVANEAQEEANEMKEAIVKHIAPNIEAILNLLKNVSNGNYVRVKVEDYGLTSPF